MNRIKEPTWLLYGKKLHCYQPTTTVHYISVCGRRTHPINLQEVENKNSHELCKACAKFLGIE